MGVRRTKLTDEQFNLLKTTDQWNIDDRSVPQRDDCPPLV